jgi:hypothetical protein
MQRASRQPILSTSPLIEARNIKTSSRRGGHPGDVATVASIGGEASRDASG